MQTRGLGILLRALTPGRAELKPPLHRKGKKPASEKSPAGLSALQSPRPASLGERSLASDLHQGDIVAAPWECTDEPGAVQYFLGEVRNVNRSERKLSVTFLTDNVLSDYSWDDPETGKMLRVNDAKTGGLFKTCGPHVVGRRLFFRSATDNPGQQYLPATITITITREIVINRFKRVS